VDLGPGWAKVLGTRGAVWPRPNAKKGHRCKVERGCAMCGHVWLGNCLKILWEYRRDRVVWGVHINGGWG
jgi:hypothetical protein